MDSLDRSAFGAQLAPILPRLEAFAFRMLAHPEDAADAVQDTLEKAYAKRASFKQESKLSTWLFSVLTRTCLDRLRHRQRWRWDAQDLTRSDPEAPHDQVLATLQSEEHAFEVSEHVAFCFSCVGRSLPPEEAAAVLLREVFGFSNQEAADICGVTESVLRHRLSAGRAAMQDSFERLCALVNKSGVCHQCAGLRDRAHSEGRGAPAPDLAGDREESFTRRLRVISDADLEGGASAELHRLMFRAVSDSEARRDGRDTRH